MTSILSCRLYVSATFAIDGKPISGWRLEQSQLDAAHSVAVAVEPAFAGGPQSFEEVDMDAVLAAADAIQDEDPSLYTVYAAMQSRPERFPKELL